VGFRSGSTPKQLTAAWVADWTDLGKFPAAGWRAAISFSSRSYLILHGWFRGESFSLVAVPRYRIINSRILVSGHPAEMHQGWINNLKDASTF